MDFSVLKSLIITSIDGLESGSDCVLFTISDGRQFRMDHDQNCCERVSIEDVCGDVEDILNSPILLAEEITSEEDPEDIKKDYHDDRFAWTFYKLSTIKGDITIRWYGESNGYYSVGVDFFEVK